MGLDKYRSKRDFQETDEPSGDHQESPTGSFRFVVQKHQARRLHYDLRLEMEGVLRSWAVPKGPSLDPSEKRLAIQVEDHPLEYGDFEGVIPPGQYGAGQVIVWDRGIFECLGGEKDPIRAWSEGKLDLRLDGHKLKGMWLLIRLKGGEENQWLFFKKDDEFADPGTEITQTAPQSVLSGREVQEVQEGDSPTWNSPVRRSLEELQIQPREIRRQVKPMLATLADEVPEGGHWGYELKYDGVRAVAVKNKEGIQLYSRNLKPLDQQFPEIVEELSGVRCNSFCLDGEVVALDEKGRSRFQLLQRRIGRPDPSAIRKLQEEVPVYYYVFDLISCEGFDLRGVTLAERKKILRALDLPGRSLRLTESVRDQGREFLRLACQEGLEGIVAKDLTSTYQSRRGRQWLKIKCRKELEFVILGYTLPSGSRRYFGALLLGLFENGNLVYVGKTGTGFEQATLKQLRGQLKKIAQAQSPLRSVPEELGVKEWVKPELVCQVRFNEWTEQGRLRAPVFVGLSPDRNPQECRRETAAEDFEGEELSYEFASNLNKVFWPGEGYTKADLLRFYHQIADVLVPYLTDRPMVLERFPDGIAGESFYQKNAPDFLPEWIPTVEVPSGSAGKVIRYILCNDRKTLVYLANLGCIAMHPWSSRVDQLDHPDFLIIDLDPSEGVPFAVVTQVALKVKQVIDAVGLESYPKTSGATGVHILVPLDPLYSYDDIRNFAEIIARLTVDGLEEIATIERSTEKRKNMVYVDYLQNGRGKTIVSPYCLRPRPGAPVSAPLEWSEVGPGLRPDSFTLNTILRRLDSKGDLFKDLQTRLQSLHDGLRGLEQLRKHD